LNRKLLVILALVLLSLTGLTLLTTNLTQPPTALNPAFLGVNSNNPTYSKSDPPSLLFITNPNNNYFNDWNSTLQSEGFTVTEIYLENLVNNISIASAFDVLILDTSCEGLTLNDAQTIAETGKPVLAVGNGGYEFLNHLGAQITSRKIVQLTGDKVITISTIYNNWDVHYHTVYQHPNQVKYNTTYNLGQVSQRFFIIPLSNDSLTLTSSPNLTPLAKDIENYGFYLSIYRNYSTNPYLVHWALHNITTISQNPTGESCLQTLINTLYWLRDKTPYSVYIKPEYYSYNPSEVVNIGIAAIYNLNLSYYGGVSLDVKVIDQNQNTAHTDQIVTSSSQLVYTSFQIPTSPSPCYTVNVTDGTLFFLESFTIQPTNYRITEFKATPNDRYLNEGAVILNACVTVEGTPAPDVGVFWSILNRITYPNANFVDNPNLYDVMGSRVTNITGYAAYSWVPEKIGIYEIVAWIKNYDGTPKNWTNTSVTVRGKPELSVNFVGINSSIIVGGTVRFEGNLTLFSQPLGSVGINVTIYCPGDRVVEYTIYIGSSGRFSLEWTPSTRGIHTIVFKYPGNSTLDSINKVLVFSAYQIVAGLETNTKDGWITLGESLQIKANFGSLGFTPKLNDPVILLVTDLDDNIVFSNGYTVDNLNYFQTQWTPEYLGDYKITLYFNESYTIATTSSTIKVASPESDFTSINVLLGLSGLSLGNSNSSGVSLPSVLVFTGLGLLGSVILFTRLKKNRNEFLSSWLLGGSDRRGL
jgi:hypothetical protein